MTEDGQLVGTTIAGKYQIRRLIGVGGMGTVYEAQHIELGKKVAVKVLDSVADTSAELATRFRREARAASAVESDGIVQVFDVGRDPEIGLFMVMELLQGEDLEARLRVQPGRRLDPLVVAQIGHQVARALVKAHGARVIHRDLKPANIFLTDRDDGSIRVKILDFGISKLLASEASIATSKERLLELTAAGVALGTPQYMSPEQAQGLTTVDHRADIWGLGVVLYEALAGIPAFPELRTYQETIINLLQHPPQPLSKIAPWVPEGFALVVHQALVHDMEKRIQDCGSFADSIAASFPDSPLGASPFSVPRQPRRGSSPSNAAYRLPGPPAAFAALAPPFPPRPAPRPAVKPVPVAPSPTRPAAAPADDTQVVVRTRDPESTFSDPEPSRTMLADSVRGAGTETAIEVRDPSKPLVPGDDGPQSGGDPTMFQSPAWVEPQVDSKNEGPATLKTGLSVAGTPRRRSTQAVSAALTAALVVVVGGAVLFVLLLAYRSSGRGESAGAAPGATVEVTAKAPLIAPETSSAAEAPSGALEVPPAADLPAVPAVQPASALPAAPAPVATAAPVAVDASVTVTITKVVPAVSAPPPIAAPPSTGTTAIPVAPATGAARVSDPPPPASADAARTAAAAR